MLHKRGKSECDIARDYGRSRATVAWALGELVERASLGRRAGRS